MSAAWNGKNYRESFGDYRKEADMEDPSLALYRHQKSLPRLPVPTLEETTEMYLKSVEGLITPEEFENTKKAVQQFLVKGGMGEVLQGRLKQRAEEYHDSSWLQHWWNQTCYLDVRDPVVINVSYYFHFADSLHRNQRTQTGRAAGLLRATAVFADRMARGLQDPEVLGGKTPLCSTAYKYMLNACRIPHRDQDSYRIYDPALYRHVVVMRNNKFFTFDLFKNGETLSFEDIETQLKAIVKAAGTKESSVGVLTSQDRDLWADARETLLADGNITQLEKIESAIICLCLDDSSPQSRDDVGRGLWHGDGRNRFFDKSIQLVVFENGKAGLLGEHSMMDGMPVVVYADFLVSSLAKGKLDLGQKKGGLTPPEKINFNISKRTLSHISAAERAFDALIGDHEMRTLAFSNYGADAIKKMKCSPDAFVQLAIQLAYRKMFNTSKATYEATQVRPFLHGRTETTRSATADAVRFSKEMVESNPGIPSLEKAKLLRKAIGAHVSYMKRAAQAKGVDRHLLGLRYLLGPGEKASIFEDPVYNATRYWNISTSHLTHELFDGWGWGEVVPDGLGVAYSVKKKIVQFNVASRKLNWSGPFCHFLDESLLEMRNLLEFEAAQELKEQAAKGQGKTQSKL